LRRSPEQPGEQRVEAIRESGMGARSDRVGVVAERGDLDGGRRFDALAARDGEGAALVGGGDASDARNASRAALSDA
jgi:hypothetical protein